MANLIKIALAASITLALTFIFSCSSGGESGSSSGDSSSSVTGDGSSSSSLVVSSSSAKENSSSSILENTNSSSEISSSSVYSSSSTKVEQSSSSIGETSSSSENKDNDLGDGIYQQYEIENLTDSSFTIVERSYDCQLDVLRVEIYSDVVSYSINGQTLSLGGIEFNGNSTSLAGTWTREAFSVSCGVDDYSCEYNNRFSKAVFTQDSLIYTRCLGIIGSGKSYTDEDGAIIKQKIINCGTFENTKGTETVRVKFSGAEISSTYNGKTCNLSEDSESEKRKACTEANDKAKAEGHGDDIHVVEAYYSEIHNKDIINCLKDNNFPEWFH
ncbi:MAG: hypothetical protein LBC75_12360 [Fibromonadaceae bacterium]|jgi:hypothetical protein|nr:hypothetical protein [Fibromonadaceae bacterium]